MCATPGVLIQWYLISDLQPFNLMLLRISVSLTGDFYPSVSICAMKLAKIQQRMWIEKCNHLVMFKVQQQQQHVICIGTEAQEAHAPPPPGV